MFRNNAPVRCCIRSPDSTKHDVSHESYNCSFKTWLEVVGKGKMRLNKLRLLVILTLLQSFWGSRTTWHFQLLDQPNLKLSFLPGEHVTFMIKMKLLKYRRILYPSFRKVTKNILTVFRLLHHIVRLKILVCLKSFQLIMWTHLISFNVYFYVSSMFTP